MFCTVKLTAMSFSIFRFQTLLAACSLMASCPIARAQICEVTLQQVPENACRGESVLLTASIGEDQITVNSGTPNTQRGVMWDVHALNGVRISDVSVQPRNTTDIEVYYKIGTYAGFESTPVVWTLLGTAESVPSTGAPVRLNLDLDLFIPAGQTFGMYVTSTNPAISLDYTNGVAAGAVMGADDNLELLEGAGVDYPFGAGTGVFSPRRLLGTLHYTADALYSWSDGSTGPAISVIAGEPAPNLLVSIPELSCSIPLEIEVPGLPPRLLPLQALLCNNDELILDAGSGGAGAGSYNWNTGSTSRFQVLDGSSFSPGIYGYWVDITHAGGCSFRDSVKVRVEAAPTLSLPSSLPQCDNQPLILDPGGEPDWNYVWSNGATSPTLNFSAGELPIGNNEFSVQATNAFTCSSSASVTVVVSACTGLPEQTEQITGLWPQPASNWVRIELPNSANRTYIISDLTGKTYQQGILSSDGLLVLELPAGFYLIQFPGLPAEKLMIQR